MRVNGFIMVALVLIVFGTKGDAEEPDYEWTPANRKSVEVLKLMNQEELAREAYPVCVQLSDKNVTNEEKRKTLTDYLTLIGLVARKNSNPDGKMMPLWIVEMKMAHDANGCADAIETSKGTEGQMKALKGIRELKEEAERSKRKREILEGILRKQQEQR
jgi:hypothetical protein